MGWSDSEDDSPAAGYNRKAPAKKDDSDDEDDWEKAEVSPVRRKDSDEEDEDEWEKKSVERDPSPPKETEKPKKKKKKNDKQKALDDPVSEKLRLLKLQQKADKEMASDLFGGEFAKSDSESSEEESDEDEEEPKRTPRGDDSDDEDKETPTKVIHSFNDLLLRREGDLEKLASLMKKKFEESVKEGDIKGPFKTYFEAMMANLEQYFTEKEIDSIIKKIEKTMSDKKKAKAAKEKEDKEKKAKEEKEKSESASASAAPKPVAKKKNKYADKEDVGVKTGNDDGFYDAFM